MEPEPTTAAPSPSASPTVDVLTAPVRPAEMDRTDEVGAVAAGEYFLSLLEFSLNSGDVTEWDAISLPGCQFCSGTRAAVVDAFANGGAFVGAEVVLTAPVEVLEYDPNIGVYALSLPFSIEPYEQLDAAGTVLRTVPAEQGVVLFEVIPTAAGWLLSGANMAVA
ncbi:MAG: hypothetical protein HGA44_12725 [Cellulomonadaceae bacterium]|nr:hypothetical protein [Cellulomonadaceae bacterium]